ncbi:MAG: hypothetical protein AAB421_04715 [Patescibacteria group bacterium]
MWTLGIGLALVSIVVTVILLPKKYKEALVMGPISLFAGVFLWAGLALLGTLAVVAVVQLLHHLFL